MRRTAHACEEHTSRVRSRSSRCSVHPPRPRWQGAVPVTGGDTRRGTSRHRASVSESRAVSLVLVRAAAGWCRRVVGASLRVALLACRGTRPYAARPRARRCVYTYVHGACGSHIDKRTVGPKREGAERSAQRVTLRVHERTHREREHPAHTSGHSAIYMSRESVRERDEERERPRSMWNYHSSTVGFLVRPECDRVGSRPRTARL